MKSLHLSALAALLAAVSVSSASAGVVPLPQAARGADGVQTAVSLDASYLAGEAREHVFFNGYSTRTFPDKRRHQLSRLDWDLDDVFLLGLSGSVRGGRASLNLGVWGGRGLDDAGTVEDFDWMMGDSRGRHGPLAEGASEYSKSDDTATAVWMADANVSFDLLDAESAFQLFPFLGVRYERHEWEERSLYTVYSDNDWQRDEDFRGVRGIDYRQQFFQPYVGLGASWTSGPFALSAYGRFAPVYWGKDHDNHLLRGFVTEDETDWEAFDDVAYGLGARAEWSLTDAVAVNVGIDWTRYALAEADVKILAQDEDEDDDDDDEETFGEELAGMELKYLTVSAGLTVRF